MQLVSQLPTRIDFSLLSRSRPEAPRGGGRHSAGRQARRAGGPQDRALYTCGCGFAFTAAVSTSVGCPHCGAGQAW
ncbi:MAG TPA: hypothetical protein VM266_00570 [Solirubrobacteraceae bacterium]|nr:hypothetical protein [Solirubrobacteraceae bacterium]